MGNVQPTDADGSTLSRTFIGADDGIRTRDPHLGKVMLYQLSHVRVRQGFFRSSGRIYEPALYRRIPMPTMSSYPHRSPSCNPVPGRVL